MTHTQAKQIFDKMIYKLSTGKTEHNPLKLGNAEYWQENGEVIHFPHTSKWDAEAISKDLERAMS